MKLHFTILLVLTLTNCKSVPNPDSKNVISEFYQDQTLKSKGQYEIKEIEDCGPGGIEILNYKFRIGNWIFYHSNGKIKAKGKYETFKTVISTRCELNEKIEFSKVGTNWEFFNEEGNKIKPTESIISELNCVTQELDNIIEVLYCYDEIQDRVVHKILEK